MAVTRTLVSDFTGQPVEKHAVVKVTVDGAVYTADADATDEIVGGIVAVGRKAGKRGRKKAS